MDEQSLAIVSISCFVFYDHKDHNHISAFEFDAIALSSITGNSGESFWHEQHELTYYIQAGKMQ